MMVAKRDTFMDGEDLQLVATIVVPPDVDGGGYANHPGAGIGGTSSSSIDGGIGDHGLGSLPMYTQGVTETTTTTSVRSIDLSPTSVDLSTLIAPDTELPANNPASTPFTSQTDKASASNGLVMGSSTFMSSMTSSLISGVQPLSTSPAPPTALSTETLHLHPSLIVGIVVPIILVALLLGLFCWWYRKKKIRERILDDLERTAIWVNGVSEVTTTLHESGDTKDLKAKATTAVTESNKIAVMDDADPTSSVGAETRSTTSPVRTCHDHTEDVVLIQRNPFATPTEEDRESVRSSQIGLAVTTSMHSHTLSDDSAETVIRHRISGGSNPFLSELEATPVHQSLAANNASNQRTALPKNTSGSDDGRDIIDGSPILRSSVETVIYSPQRSSHDP